MVTGHDLSGLRALGMWEAWQHTVIAGLPNFARCPLYVNQTAVTLEEVETALAGLGEIYDPMGMTRDVEHGARVFETIRGPVTRMWVDGNVEIGFLARTLPMWLRGLTVLDVGAGYGRLAVMLSPLVQSYVCVDPVPVSVKVCREYTQRYAPAVRVLDVAQLIAEIPAQRPTLAINIHSWNECSPEQISLWLDALEEMSVLYLFTVSHGPDTDFYPTWQEGASGFKPLLQARYDVVAEASLGIGSSPHVLWRRRAA